MKFVLLGTDQSVKRLATRWTVPGSNPVGSAIILSHPTWPGDNPASYVMSKMSPFAGGKVVGTYRSIEDKERVHLYRHSPGLHGLLKVEMNLLFLLLFIFCHFM